jgi:8-oxo-dGTP diphosphatase
MQNDISLTELLSNPEAHFLPSVSIDNVIFGFHDNQLKALLLQSKARGDWSLPGGYVYKEEDIEDAAVRILKNRTNLQNIFLQQFHIFGSTSRTNLELLKDTFKSFVPDLRSDSWFLQRFVSVGYYALVEFEKVIPQADELSSSCSWHDLNDLPELILDHKLIIEKALQTLRLQLTNQPIGYNLLPNEFTLGNLQLMYEAILGRKLDRANFNRKVLGYGVLEKREKLFSGAAHKAPYLYAYNKDKYFDALKDGLWHSF